MQTRMARDLFWINQDENFNGITHATKAQRSIVQSQVQRGRPRKRKPKTSAAHNHTQSRPKDLVRPQELYDPFVRSMSAETDPFDTACIPIDLTAKGLMRYYVHTYHPSQWPNAPFASNTGAYTFKSAVDRIMNTAVQDSLLMYCLLTATSSRLQHADNLSFPNVAKKENQYTNQALQLMQTRLDDPQIGSTSDLSMLLQCITFLTSAESYRNNFAAAKVHLKACLALVDAYGGITALQDEHVQGQILMGDLFCACIDLEPCLCGCEYDPGPASELDLQMHELLDTHDDSLGTALLAKDEHILPLPLLEAAEQIVEVYFIKHHLNTGIMSPARALETGQWVTKRNMAIRNRLLAYQYGNSKIQALRVVLIMWTLLAMNYTGRVKTVKIMVNSLRDILLRMSREDWHGNFDVQLWILFVGHACAAEGSDVSAWFLEQIQNVAVVHLDCVLGIHGSAELLERLEAFQKGFLYHTPVQRPFTMQVASSLQQKQEQELVLR